MTSSINPYSEIPIAFKNAMGISDKTVSSDKSDKHLLAGLPLTKIVLYKSSWTEIPNYFNLTSNDVKTVEIKYTLLIKIKKNDLSTLNN